MQKGWHDHSAIDKLRTSLKHTVTDVYVCGYIYMYMGGCQNYGPFLGTLNIRGRIIIGTQKGAIILTTTQVSSKQTQQ